MTTESPMRMVESSGPGKWPSSRDAATFTLPLNNMAAEELGLLLKSHRLDRDQRETVPNRSGSAPPSMEGSFAAIGNLLAQQNSGLNASLADFSSAIESCESEEQLRADPAYFAYYCSNVNLNPRLPPPLISRENQRLVRHIGGFGNNPKLTSFDDSSNGSMELSRGLLSTHKEEPEDDRSSPQASDDWMKSSGASMIGEKTAFLAGRHKSLVDLIQEDFPRTPSPVYNLSCSSSHATTEEPIDIVLNSMSLSDPSANILRLSESNSGFVNSCTDASSLDPHNIGLMSSDPSATSFSRIQNRGGIPPLQKDEPSSNSTKLVDDVPINAVAQSDNTIMESITRGGSKVSDLVAENDINKQKHKHSYERNMQQHHPSQQGGTTNQVHGVRTQLVSQGMNSYSGLDVSRGHPKFSSMEVQPPLHSPGLTPPLYATAAAYMNSGNPYYPNLQPSGIFTPQYNMGGYALSSAIYPPYIAGYPSHGAIPMSFDATSCQSLNVRTAGISAGESISHVGHMQHANKFYGQHGLMLQPPFVDPLHMQYFQNSFEGVYGPAGQYGPLASRGAFGDQGVNTVSKESSAYMDENFLLSTNGSLSIPSPRKGGITSNSYNGGSPSMGFMTQFPASPASPMPRSPVGATNYPGRRDEMRFPQDSIRHAEVYNAWQGQRGGSGCHDLKRHSFLEELKSTNSRKFELSDITGRIVEFSVDQHGSRFIQQKLENCTVEEKGSVFKEVIPHASKLMIDVFGNYVIQKFFEHGSPEQRAELADQLAGQILPLSLQMYGCRVIQKALEVIELDQKTQLVHELDGNVMRCVRDQNGNHVIQKCIECVPTKKIGFIISAFRGHVATLSTHPYGCRVIQRILEHCSDEVHSQCIVDEILESACVLAQDQYGNYVIQHVLERGKPHERCQIISKLTGKIVQMSQHKYASNVVEKCLEYGDAAERELFIGEIIGQSEENDNLLAMMKDQFANFVVQKILETSSDKQREILLNRIRIHLQALKKYTYGKHIVARFEQLAGDENQESEPLGS